MKKLILIIMIILLLLPTNFIYANKFAEYEIVELIDSKTGEANDYKVVNILVDGDDVLSDVPAIIYDLNGESRTLVPISFIAKKIGADIAWNGEERQVTINYKGKEIILTIDSDKALVDGKTYDLPSGVPAKLMSFQGIYRTMVPVNFVSQQLGYEIFWLGETMTVSINKPLQTLTNMRYDNSGLYPELRFAVTGEVSVSSFSVDGKSVGGEDTLILDFYNTKLDLKVQPKYGKYIINDIFNDILDVKLEQTSISPHNIKVTVGLGYFRNGDVYYDNETGEMVVRLINSVNYVDVEEIGGYKTVVIDTSEYAAYNMYEENGKFYVDIIHSMLKYENTEDIIVNSGGLKTIKYYSADNDIKYDYGTRVTRIEVGLDSKTSSDNIYVEGIGSKLYVYVTGKAIGDYSYGRDIALGSSTMKIDLINDASYDIEYNKTANVISFKLPKENITFEPYNRKSEDGVVNRIMIGEDSNSDYLAVEIYLEKGAKYIESNKEISDTMVLTFVNDKLINPQFNDKIVVIDAGHGGHDPGASSKAGTREKDVALKASLILKKKLENYGFKVYMTRERDNYVKLYERAAIANQLGADLFISVHINAARSTSAKGIEVLYNPDPARNNKALARAIENKLIEYTGAVERGIVSRPKLVVIRETKMDAVLVELGFLSNTQDEMNLLTDSYLIKCANGILDGIIDFLN